METLTERLNRLAALAGERGENTIRRAAHILARECDSLGIELRPDGDLTIPFMDTGMEARLLLRRLDIFGVIRNIDQEVVRPLVDFAREELRDPQLSDMIRTITSVLSMRIQMDERGDEGEDISR